MKLTIYSLRTDDEYTNFSVYALRTEAEDAAIEYIKSMLQASSMSPIGKSDVFKSIKDGLYSAAIDQFNDETSQDIFVEINEHEIEIQGVF